MKRIFNFIKKIFRALQWKKKYEHFYNVRKNIYLIGSEDFGNVGDHQIALSELKFLKQIFPQNTIIELPASIYFLCHNKIKEMIKKDDLIFLTGGGNFGNEYKYAQEIRRDIVGKFRDNYILIFPVTIFYTNDDDGEKEKAIDKKLFNRNNLLILSRDRYSFELSENMFPKAMHKLMPDIVFTEKRELSKNKEGYLFCFRDDLESNLKPEERKYIERYAERQEKKVEWLDTQFKKNISISKRETCLDYIMKKFSDSELVITDRLHGVIFSVINNTPCIALRNYNYKIDGVAEWLSEEKNFLLIDSVVDLDDAVKKVTDKKNSKYQLEKYREKFEGVKRLIQYGYE
mgnify:CR=1 FL=1